MSVICTCLAVKLPPADVFWRTTWSESNSLPHLTIPFCPKSILLSYAAFAMSCTAGDKAHEEMRDACFDYLQLGGVYSSGPVSLLSGLNPRPSVLVMHFFMVALYGVGRLLLPRPSVKGVWMG